MLAVKNLKTGRALNCLIKSQSRVQGAIDHTTGGWRGFKFASRKPFDTNKLLVHGQRYNPDTWPNQAKGANETRLRIYLGL